MMNDEYSWNVDLDVDNTSPKSDF